MLSYKIKQNNTNNSNTSISIKKIELIDLNNGEFDKKLLLKCEYNNNEHLSANMKIFATNEITLTSNESAHNMNKTYDFNETLVVNGVNEKYKCFTSFVDKYYNLAIDTLSIQTIADVKYLYVYFKYGHFFERKDFNGNDNDEIVLFFEYSYNGETKLFPIRFEYITNTILRCKYENIIDSKVLNEVVNWIKTDKKYSFNDITISDAKELLQLLFPNGVSDENVVGSLVDVNILRFTFLYEDDNKTYLIKTILKYNVPLYTIPIILSDSSQTDVDKEMNIKEYFVDDRVKNSINKINDMEKNIYTPVIWDNEKNTESSLCLNEIRFNLHFRNHSIDDKWTIRTSDSFWNGTYISEDGKALLMNDVSSDEGNGQFFSKDVNSQADLLYYLGFTDKDIKYQKNKLKKSFLRLSFYDSTNEANQNLLAYYTVFYNIGDAYARFMRYYSVENCFYATIDNETMVNKKKLIGIRVNREPYDLSKNIKETVDDFRLSAQFSIKDKYNASNCSEGFYLYLWMDDDNGVIPTDIYLKVEFNHAGYGRSIPFMMPFVDTKKHPDSNAKIKDFQDILDDFNEEKDAVDKPYGIRQYLKYSYIHFKYRYDKQNLRYVYHLDEETYGNYIDNPSVYDKQGVLSLNLYEAKIN